MAVKKKILKNVSTFIEKGADVKAKKGSKFKNVLVRIPTEILEEISFLIKMKPELNRTLWIIEALREKLKRES